MFKRIAQWVASRTFTIAGFILPQKGLLIILGVILTIAGGLAYTWTKANHYRVQVHVLAERLDRATQDIEVLRSMVRVAEQGAVDAATREAETQYKVKKVQREVLRSTTTGSTPAERLRNTREAAISAINAIEGSTSEGSTPGDVHGNGGETP